MGALTSSISAFSSRVWDKQKRRIKQITDLFVTLMQIDLINDAILRVLSVVGQEEWLTDLIRNALTIILELFNGALHYKLVLKKCLWELEQVDLVYHLRSASLHQIFLTMYSYDVVLNAIQIAQAIKRNIVAIVGYTHEQQFVGHIKLTEWFLSQNCGLMNYGYIITRLTDMIKPLIPEEALLIPEEAAEAYTEELGYIMHALFILMLLFAFFSKNPLAKTPLYNNSFTKPLAPYVPNFGKDVPQLAVKSIPTEIKPKVIPTENNPHFIDWSKFKHYTWKNLSKMPATFEEQSQETGLASFKTAHGVLKDSHYVLKLDNGYLAQTMIEKDLFYRQKIATLERSVLDEKTRGDIASAKCDALREGIDKIQETANKCFDEFGEENNDLCAQLHAEKATNAALTQINANLVRDNTAILDKTNNFCANMYSPLIKVEKSFMELQELIVTYYKSNNLSFNGDIDNEQLFLHILKITSAEFVNAYRQSKELYREHVGYIIKKLDALGEQDNTQLASTSLRGNHNYTTNEDNINNALNNNSFRSREDTHKSVVEDPSAYLLVKKNTTINYVTMDSMMIPSDKPMDFLTNLLHQKFMSFHLTNNDPIVQQLDEHALLKILAEPANVLLLDPAYFDNLPINYQNMQEMFISNPMDLEIIFSPSTIMLTLPFVPMIAIVTFYSLLFYFHKKQWGWVYSFEFWKLMFGQEFWKDPKKLNKINKFIKLKQKFLNIVCFWAAKKQPKTLVK